MWRAGAHRRLWLAAVRLQFCGEGLLAILEHNLLEAWDQCFRDHRTCNGELLVCDCPLLNAKRQAEPPKNLDIVVDSERLVELKVIL